MFKKENILHIAIILIATILLLVVSFNTNVWFDESYSVGMAEGSWEDLIVAGVNDVHPILYYIILKIFMLITEGFGMFAYRLFSVVPIIISMIFGFTAIKKEFGLKIGAWFSFLMRIYTNINRICDTNKNVSISNAICYLNRFLRI